MLSIIEFIDPHPLSCLKMQFDVTFPVIPCSLLSLDAMDISGEQHLDIVCVAMILPLIFTSLHTVFSFLFLSFPVTDYLPIWFIKLAET